MPTITVAYNITALEKTESPEEVLASSVKWADNIGIISEEPLNEIIDFEYNNNIQTDFNSGTQSIDEALGNIHKKIATDRHIYIGTSDSHKKMAEKHGWEYLTIQDAASEADWELSENYTNPTQSTVISDIKEDKLEEGTEYDHFFESTTHRWYEINRGNKTWLIRREDEEINEETVSENDVALIYRGLNETHQLEANVDEVRLYDTIEDIIDDIDYELIRPTSEEKNVIKKLIQSHKIKDDDSFVAIKISVIEE